MASFTSVLRKDRRIRLEALRDDWKARKNKEFFKPSGTQVYCGRQGSGKTISAVAHVLRLKHVYYKSILVSNLDLYNFTPIPITTEEKLRADLEIMIKADNALHYYFFFENMEQLSLALVLINNEFYGVIYLVDEIHTYFNSLESKNIPLFVFTEISQQRKQRKLIIGTSQLFLRMAKPFREQCDNLIMCSTKFGVFSKQVAYDGMSVSQDKDGGLIGTPRKTGYFFHSRAIRNSFDTYQKVVSGVEQYDTSINIDNNIGEIKPKGFFKKRK